MSMKKTYVHLGSNALLSATIFFVITNFAVWMSGTMYPLTIDGLLLCYTMAIPFFGNTLAGTLFYVSLLGLVCVDPDPLPAFFFSVFAGLSKEGGSERFPL